MADCFRYYKGCEECQGFGNVQLVPAMLLHPIIKPWLFTGWGLGFIGQINPPSSKGHRFVLVATDYFTKWTEVVPLKNMTHREVIEFIIEHIIHRCSISQTLTADHHLYKKRCVHLQYFLISCSIHLHTILRRMVSLSQVIRS